MPYRHGLDFVSDLAAALTNQAADVAERRRLASDKPVHRMVDDDPFAEDQGVLARFFTNPVALGGMLFVLLALVGAREAFGTVVGGALAPGPGLGLAVVAAPRRVVAPARAGHRRCRPRRTSCRWRWSGR